MKFGLAIIIALMMLVPVMASAQTAVSKKTANTYYASCMIHADERLSTESQESLCSCAAARMMEKMNLEEVAEANPAPGRGRPSYNKMLTTVYGPCLQIPIENELARQCKADERIQKFNLRDTTGLCECVGQRTGDYMSKNTNKIVGDLLQKWPSLKDLYEPLLNDTMIRTAASNNLYTCMHDQR